MFLHEWLMWKFRAKHRHGCFLRGLCMYTNWKMTSIEINTQINHFYLFTVPLLRRLGLIYIPRLSAVWCCCVWRCGVEQVEEHPPLWWGPWSGSRSARACVGCTVMSWRWSAETAAQPRPPRARHRTSARRPSAREDKTGRGLLFIIYHGINMDRSTDRLGTEEISISWWLTQSLPSTHNTHTSPSFPQMP